MFSFLPHNMKSLLDQVFLKRKKAAFILAPVSLGQELIQVVLYIPHPTTSWKVVPI